MSMPIFPGMPSFPGDPPVSVAPVLRLARGDPYALAELRLGSHAGTHLDAPRHFREDGTPVDRIDLDRLNGPAYLLRVPDDRPAVSAREIAGVPRGTTRLLLRTANSARWARRLEFFPQFVALTPDGARSLFARGIRCVGIDALSIESELGDRFPVHRYLLGHGIPILEGLLLDRVPPGPCELYCLPLRLRDGDGAPARAAVRRSVPAGRKTPERGRSVALVRRE